MTYGVPVGVRDALLASVPGRQMAAATSDANAMYQHNETTAALANGAADGGARVAALEPSRELLQLARSLQARRSRKIKCPDAGAVPFAALVPDTGRGNRWA
jgi:hypothetical protein